MKSLLTFAISSVLLSGSISACFAQQKTKSIPEISSKQEMLNYRIGGELRTGWRISPDLKPDRLKVECKTKNVPVTFLTDSDSLSFTVNEGDTIQFKVLYNNQVALTEIVGTPKNVNFSKKYIKKHKGKYDVAVPEVHELANILVAISRVGQLDSNMVDMTTPYYKEVMAHFKPYSNHPIVDTLNKYIVKPQDNNSYWYYYALKMNACGYVFNKKNEIVDDGIIHKMGFDYPEDPILANLALINDFAKKSGFREFYKKHTPYYNNLLVTYKAYNPISKMQNWLETKFDLQYGSYLVTFSPLVGGAHSTQRFEDNGFSQTVMFVCRTDAYAKYNRPVNEMLHSRVVFTEIDHNFVNPLSEKYSDQINSIFNNRTKWTNGNNQTNAYSSPYAVFNEYMTWALYSLYCHDLFSKQDLDQFIPMMERQMEKNRGFVRFGDFNQKLLALYTADKNKSITQLYDEMLKWSQEQ
ncbi:MAG: DUF4932 domain-containing protein [Hymenobacteraceae bacterium]|nr:DUF4932 domain-containing protein [Hymenobacteraceae bacterium]